MLAKTSPGLKPEDIDRLRDELNVISNIHRGTSLVWLCEAIREWHIKTVRLQTYVNVDHEFGFISDCPIERHLGKTFRFKTNTSLWSTWNQIAMISVSLLVDGNWLSVPLFGFMETPNVPRALAVARKLGWTFDIMSTSFFLSRRALKPAARSGMPRWQDRLFIMLTRFANDATDYFQIPTGRVVEVGTQVTI